MKIAISYKNKIYIKEKVEYAILQDKINGFLDVLNIPLQIHIFNNRVSNKDIKESMQYIVNKKKKLNLPKPILKYEEFTIEKEE